jgi:hypothetical protein
LLPIRISSRKSVHPLRDRGTVGRMLLKEKREWKQQIVEVLVERARD